MEEAMKNVSKIFSKKKKIPKSMFIKEGKILKENDKLPYYDFKNFEKIKLSGGNNYHILGNGAFGSVYLVKNKIDGKLFAMKQMDKSRLMSVGIKPELVYREVNIHMKLQHEHIVRLYSYHEDNKAFYLIIDYVENGTLFSKIQKTKGLSEELTFKYFIQIASAIDFLHENGLMHRDLKPENCLVDKKGNIKICDFGWTVEATKGQRVTFCGTYEYMAPEIIKEMPYNNSVDIWSLGILLYELLHSYSPFRAKKLKNVNNLDNEQESALQVLQNIMKNNFRIEKNISPQCEDLIFKLLCPDIKARITARGIFNHPWVLKYEKIINGKHKKSEENSIDESKNVTILNNENTQDDTLFNTVLDQIIGTKKKNKNLSSSKNGHLNVSSDNKENKNPNKIVLKVEKVENNRNHLIMQSIFPIEEENMFIKNKKRDNPPLSPIKRLHDIYDESNYSMFKELNEIDRQIDERSKQLESIQKKADKMKRAIEKLSLNNRAEEISYRKKLELNLLENLTTQPQSLFVDEGFNSMMTKNDLTNNKKVVQPNYFESNCNDELILRKKLNMRNSKGIYNKRRKNQSELGVNFGLDTVHYNNKISNEILEFSENDPIKNIVNRNEISTQTETPSFWKRFFSTFKCG